MTDYFEVLDRDTAARLAELRLAEPVRTPALVDEYIEDAGSEWVADRPIPEGDQSVVTILPHRAIPPGTHETVREAFDQRYPAVDYPSGAVVTPDTARDVGADVYVLSNPGGVVGHAEAFVDAIIRTRRAIPADTALYLPGVATPRNVSTLVYAGVDLVDRSRAMVKGSQGKVLTTDGEYFREDLAELPATAEQPPSGVVGDSSDDGSDRAEQANSDTLIDHNVRALKAELATVRERIRAGRLRDYIEAQARHEQWLTATFRRLDDEYAYLEQRTPILRRAEISACSDDTIRRVEIQRFANRVTSRYRNQFSNPLVLVPCSAVKPYSESQSHSQFHDAIQFRAHKVSMTSPIGVVPQELELTYPAQHYDTVVTGRWSETERAFLTRVLEAYLEGNEYPRIIAHVPGEGYRDICERVESSLGLDFEYTVPAGGHPTDTDSLANLASTLSSELKYGKRERQHNTIRAIAAYQFGESAADGLFPDFETEAHYPKLRVRDTEGTQLAMLVPQYGVLALTLAGARRWVDSPVPVRRIEIDEFVPHGSVLAPGVVSASDEIRPGDEVIIEGPRAFAVGRAEMSGPEMVESTRGIASSVRHVTET